MITGNCAVSATFAINTYSITASAGSNGTISPTGTVTVNYGASQAFTFTPNTGYYIAGVTVDNASQGSISSYNFTNVTANHTISASFQPCSGTVRIGGTYYSGLQAAYNAATDGAVIQSQNVTLIENVNANRAISVTLDGGYRCDYSVKTGVTSLSGSLTTDNGTTTIKDFVLQQ